MKSLVVVLFIFYLVQSAFGKAVVSDLKLTKNGKFATFTATMDSEFNESPEVSVRNNILQIVLPNASAWPKIEKRSTVNKSMDTTLMAYQYTKKLVRMRALLPFSLKGKEDFLSTTIKGNQIAVTFPIEAENKEINSLSFNTGKAPKVVKKKLKKSVTKYDESYLEKLLTDKVDSPKEKKEIVKADKVETIQAAPKRGESKFKVSNYIYKFAVFLVGILALFYGVVVFFKKGVLKKGKLSFLKNSELVTVLNTTYIGPKRSILLVKAHNQIFLVGSSEQGLNFLSEVDGLTDVLKTGEKLKTGSNFEDVLEVKEQNKKAAEVVLKDEIDSSYKNKLDKFLKKPEKKRYSDKVKKKIKDLKPMQ